MSLIWLDSETTGLSVENGQMLSFAMVLTDLSLKEVDHIYFKIRLGEGITPTKEALATNKLDPYSLEWYSESITEEVLCSEVLKFTNKINPSHFLAYNSKFDEGFVNDLFLRKKTESPLLNKKIVDPSKLAKDLTQKDIILTPKNKYGKRTFRLEEMSKHLDSSIGEAHNALADTRTIILTTKKMIEKANISLTDFLNKY